MQKVFFVSLASFLLALTLLVLGAGLCFTDIYFSSAGLHPAALSLINGEISPEELRRMVINGYFMTWPEIHHLEDVAQKVSLARWGLLALMPLTLAAAWICRENLRAVCLAAWGWLAVPLAAGSLAWVGGGRKTVSDLFHSLFFAPGSWTFPRESLLRQLYGWTEMQNGLLFVSLVACVFLAGLTLACWRRGGYTPSLAKQH